MHPRGVPLSSRASVAIRGICTFTTLILVACSPQASRPGATPVAVARGRRRVAQLRPRCGRDALLAAHADRPRQRRAAHARVDLSHRRARSSSRLGDGARRAPPDRVRDDAARRRRHALLLHAVLAPDRARRRDGRASGGCTIRIAARDRKRVSGPHRGIAYWEGRGASGATEARILFGTTDGRLVALDARTGRPVPTFGDGGDGEPARRRDRRRGLVHDDVASRDLARPRHHGRARPRDGVARTERRHARLRRAHGRARVAIPHGAARGGGRQRDVGAGLVARSHRRERLVDHVGGRRARARLPADSAPPRPTSMAATERAPTSTRTRSSRSMRRRESCAGTASSCITTSGTTTSRRRPRS